MSAPWRGPVVRDEAWEHDPPHQALLQWVRAYRETRPHAALPGLEFTKHVGIEAVDLADGLSPVELQRLFWEAGRDAECVCGMPVGDRPVGAALGGLAAATDSGLWTPSGVLDREGP